MLGRGLGHVLLDLGLGYGAGVAGLQGWKRLVLRLVLAFAFAGHGFQGLHIPPAVLQHHPAGGAEGMLTHLGDDPGGVVFARGIERRQHPPDHQVPQLPLLGAHFAQVRPAGGGQQGVVVGDLAGVKNPLGDRQLSLGQRAGHQLLVAFRQ